MEREAFTSRVPLLSPVIIVIIYALWMLRMQKKDYFGVAPTGSNFHFENNKLYASVELVKNGHGDRWTHTKYVAK